MTFFESETQNSGKNIEFLADEQLYAGLIPDIRHGHGLISRFSLTLRPAAREKLAGVNAWQGELRSVQEARIALYCIFSGLHNEMMGMDDEPDTYRRVAEILDYLRSHVRPKQED